MSHLVLITRQIDQGKLHVICILATVVVEFLKHTLVLMAGVVDISVWFCVQLVTSKNCLCFRLIWRAYRVRQAPPLPLPLPRLPLPHPLLTRLSRWRKKWSINSKWRMADSTKKTYLWWELTRRKWKSVHMYESISLLKFGGSFCAPFPKNHEFVDRSTPNT